MDAKVNRLHWHRCYACEDMLVCACEDRRQFDRETGKERRIYCFGCAELSKLLAIEFDDLQKVSGHATKIN